MLFVALKWVHIPYLSAVGGTSSLTPEDCSWSFSLLLICMVFFSSQRQDNNQTDIAHKMNPL